MVLWLCGVSEVALSWYGAQKIKEVTAQRSNVSSKMFKTFMQHAMLLLQFWQIEALWRGKPGLRWRQRRSQASTQECWVHLCYTQSLRCQFGRWKRCDMGQSRLRWRQQSSEGSAPECSAGSCHRSSICCNFGRQKCCDMGRSGVTEPKSGISSWMFSRFMPQPELLLQFWQIKALRRGEEQPTVATAPKSGINSGMLSTFMSHAEPSLPVWQMEALWCGVIPPVAATAPQSVISFDIYSSKLPANRKGCLVSMALQHDKKDHR